MFKDHITSDIIAVASQLVFSLIITRGLVFEHVFFTPFVSVVKLYSSLAT